VTTVALLLAALLVLVTAVLRAAGASLVRTSQADALHDAAQGDERAGRVAGLLEDRLRIQPALSPVVTSLVVLAVIPATWAFASMFTGWSLFVVLLSMALLVIILVDLVPRTIGRRSPGRLAYRFSRLLVLALKVGDAANDLVADDEEPEEEPEADEAEAQERELISSVLEFTDTIVREVMVPRTDMITVPASASTDEALDVVLEAGRSRIPLSGDGVDDIVGLLYARDLLQLFDDEAPSRPCGDIARAPYFVPETKHIAQLMREMQASQVHMAIVVDEFGGTAGLVTIEDLVEEIVGEIADEYDSEEPLITPLEGGSYLIDARLDIESLAGLLGVEVPSDEWDTVGGLVLGLAGRVPREGEIFEYDGFTITAQQVQGRRVSKVRVARR
jgi:CBS domain containing-hemolysin-like protein